MFGLTVRQKIAALVLLLFLVAGGLVLYLRGNQTVVGEFPVDNGQRVIYAHICGAVTRPAVYHFRPGIRKYEALKTAGGALPDADLNQINLAEYLEDGEQVYLPRKGEVLTKSSRQSSRKQRQTSGGIGGKSTPKPTVKFPCDLNKVTQNELDAVPGIGPVMAGRIIEYRSAHGSFSTYDELGKVSGIGPSKLEKFRPYLIVP